MVTANTKNFKVDDYLVQIPKFDKAKGQTYLVPYLPVAGRLVWLRQEHPDAHIETELRTHFSGTAVMYARVTLPSGAWATGWGSANRSDFQDYVMKAETRAIGRALAKLGYGDASEFDEERVPAVSGPTTPKEPVKRSESNPGATVGLPEMMAPVFATDDNPQPPPTAANVTSQTAVQRYNPDRPPFAPQAPRSARRAVLVGGRLYNRDDGSLYDQDPGTAAAIEAEVDIGHETGDMFSERARLLGFPNTSAILRGLDIVPEEHPNEARKQLVNYFKEANADYDDALMQLRMYARFRAGLVHGNPHDDRQVPS